MRVRANDFVSAARIAIRDPQLQVAVTASTTNSDTRRLEAMFAISHEHGEHMRRQAAEAKRRALRDLPQLLERAEANMLANGIQVLWAKDGPEACRLVLEIAQRHSAKRVVKSKSMLTEEIALNPALESQGLEVFETDLGEYIVQIAKEAPSHIVGPALHMSKNDIRDLFVRELGMSHTDNAEEMTQFVREILRQKFIEADIGISGGNFIIASTGSLCLSTNEGNGRMVTTLPPVHVAIVGIEKIVKTLDDYATLVQILARSSTGQTITVYNQMIHGPRRANEDDGPDHVYVILVDNGRSDIYQTKYAEVLACLRCGACLNACPVYRAAGGHAYGWVYSGPIGAVVTPLLTGLENARPLPYASSLCGKCKDVCPVDIDLPRMLLELRRDLIDQGHGALFWALAMRSWSMASQSPRLFEGGARAIRSGIRFVPPHLPGPVGDWTQYRDLPSVSSTSFRQLWRDYRKGKGHEQP